MIPTPPQGFPEALELFFSKPVTPTPVGVVSPLLLCRQELQDCFCGAVVGEDHVFDFGPRRLFATTMVALSGIELLGSMVPPPALRAGRGEIFTSTVTTYSKRAGIPVMEADARILLRIRNALSHTFGLHDSEIGLNIYSQNQPADVVGALYDRQGSCTGYEVCIESLIRLFIRMIPAVQSHIAENADLQDHFMAAFARHGHTYHQGPHSVRG